MAGQDLASLPVPSLEETCARLVSSVETVAGAGAIERTKAMVHELLEPDSIGRLLQKRLLENAERHSQGNWQADLWVRKEYLELRSPLVPSTSFFVLQADLGKGHTMLERAALICGVVKEFEDTAMKGDLSPDVVGGLPQDMDCYKTMFHKYRVPSTRTDVLCESKARAARHVVVLWRGNFFRIAMPQSKAHGAKLYWQASLAGILQNNTENAGNRIGALTAWHRDGWAKARRTFADNNPSNKALLDIIDGASFILCLDDAASEDTESMARQLWIGNASNRWYDKPLQFVVFSNGRSGFVGEHSVLVGRPSLRLLNCVTAAILASDSEVDAPPPLDNNAPPKEAQPLPYKLCPSICASIAQSHVDFVSHIDNQKLKYIQSHAFGRKTFETTNFSANTLDRLVLMLAATEYYGRLVPAYDPISMSHIAGGRFEKCRLATHATRHFIDSIRSADLPTSAKRGSLEMAARAHAGAVAEVRAGKGIDGHLLGLRAMVRDGEEVPLLFEDEAVTQSERWLVSMSYMETSGLQYGFGQIVDEGWGVGFMLSDKHLGLYPSEQEFDCVA